MSAARNILAAALDPSITPASPDAVAEREAAVLAEWQADRDRERAADVARMVPGKYRGVTPVDLHPALADWTPTQSVYLTGPSGCGKTHQLAALAKRAAELASVPAWFDSIDLVDRLRRSQRDPENYPQRAWSASIVVIDDFGKERTTEYVLEQLFSLVNHAYQNERVLLISSELDLQSIASKTSTAIARRLGEMSGGDLELAAGWWKR